MDEITRNGDIFLLEELIETDLNDLCRICGSTSEETLVSIFDNPPTPDLPEKIMKYLPIKVYKKDNLSLKACVDCVHSIFEWHQFYENCSEANAKMQILFVDNKHSEDIVIQHDGEETSAEYVENSNLDENPNYVTMNEVHQTEESRTSLSNAENTDQICDEKSDNESEILIEENIKDEEIENVFTEGSDYQAETEESDYSQNMCTQEVLYQPCGTEISSIPEIHDYHTELLNVKCEFYSTACDENSSKIEAEHECQICTEKFFNKMDLRRHITQHETIICYLCNKMFKTYTNLLSHKKLHFEPSQTFDCPICGWNMNRRFNLQMHINSHTADHPCKICCKSFNSDLILSHHRLTHSKEDLESYEIIKTFVKCDNCEEEFNSKFKLYMHKIAHHSEDEPRYTCHCGRIFETEVMLKNHEKSHMDANFACEVCNKKFKKLRNLEEHRNTHLENRPFKCDVCNKQFKYSSNLSQHKALHKGVKNYKCMYCDKKFLRSNTLAAHLKTHENLRNFKCEHCGISFVQSSTLMKHKKTIHRTCDYCGAMVGDKKQWQIHVWKKCTNAPKIDFNNKLKS